MEAGRPSESSLSKPLLSNPKGGESFASWELRWHKLSSGVLSASDQLFDSKEKDELGALPLDIILKGVGILRQMQFIKRAEENILVDSAGQVIIPLSYVLSQVFFVIVGIPLLPFGLMLVAFAQPTRVVRNWRLLASRLAVLALGVGTALGLILPIILNLRTDGANALADCERLATIEIVGPCFGCMLFNVGFVTLLMHVVVIEAVARNGLRELDLVYSDSGNPGLMCPDTLVRLKTAFLQLLRLKNGNPLGAKYDFGKEFMASIIRCKVHGSSGFNVIDSLGLLQRATRSSSEDLPQLVPALLLALLPALWRKLVLGGSFVPFEDPLRALLGLSYMVVVFQVMAIYLASYHKRKASRADMMMRAVILLFFSGTKSCRSYFRQRYSTMLGRVKGIDLTQSSELSVLKNVLRTARLKPGVTNFKEMNKTFGGTLPVYTLSMKKFKLMRLCQRLEFTKERILMEYGFAYNISIGAMWLFFAAVSLHDYDESAFNPTVAAVGLASAIHFLLAAQSFSDAVAMNTIVSDNTILVLRSWKERLQWLRWKAASTPEIQQNPLSPGGSNLAIYFDQLGNDIAHEIEFVTSYEQPIVFFGVAITSSFQCKLAALAAPVMVSATANYVRSQGWVKELEDKLSH